MFYNTLVFISFVALSVVTAYDGEFNVDGTPLTVNKEVFASLDEPAPGVVPTPEPTPVPKPEQKCEKVKFSCVNSCSSPEMQYCTEIGADPVKESCSPDQVCADQSGYLQCTNKESTVCKVQGFKCPSPSRFYPNINDCQSYYYCDENSIGTQYYCPANFAYDPLRHNCGPMALGTKCYTVTCPAQPKVLPYIGDKSLYVVCMAGRGTVLQCEEPAEFSPRSETCVGQCRARGKFAFKNDATCRKFFTCLRPKGEPVPDQCPIGTVFNQATQSCNTGTCERKPKLY
ncbi:uncharacterized protein LOC113378273 [Ctenocephalides felis]|uniref:uncharacterized protein LOC113378273 n=1 Tax=Ctenocephalides felis TaxID=7515 RepID=UPI000E6E2595|nr:uncharacterized protein LOC113378273 [Ctenocephalides felis]